MRKLFFGTTILVALFLLAFASNEPLPIGSTLPKADTKLKDVSGKEVSIKEVKKKNGVLVMFSCNTCPFVIKNQERTIAICSYAEKNNIGAIILNSNAALRSNEDSYEAMQEYAKEQKYNWKYVVDENNTMADAFGANRTPECFLFDKELKLVYHGAIDNSPADAQNITRKHLQIAIDELVAGKEIAVKESKSVGCSIKRKA